MNAPPQKKWAQGFSLGLNAALHLRYLNDNFFSDTAICTGCCSTLDNIVSYIFKEMTLKGNFFLKCIVLTQY